MNIFKNIFTIQIIFLLSLRSLCADEELSLRDSIRLEEGYSAVAHINDSKVTIYLTNISKLDKIKYILLGDSIVEYKDDILRVNLNPPTHAYNVRLLWTTPNNKGIVTPAQMVRLEVQMPTGRVRGDIKKIEFKFTEINVPVEIGIKAKSIIVGCDITDKSTSHVPGKIEK